jgi:tetratricopeptide (TPR) repeat protein
MTSEERVTRARKAGASLSAEGQHQRALKALAEVETNGSWNFRTAGFRLTPDDAKAHAKLGELLASVGRIEEAIAHLEAAQRIHFDPAISKILAGLREGQR